MASYANQVLLQASYYGIAMLIVILAIGFMQRGFFWKYFRVRMSFGRFVLVKIRNVLRDHYSIGRIEDGFLVFKLHGDHVRMNVRDPRAIYKSIAVNWVDVDEEKNAVMLTTYEAVTGYDAKKFDNLYVRCLTRPGITTMRDKILLVVVVVTGLIVIGSLVLGVQNYMIIKELPGVVQATINNVMTESAGVVPAG